MLGVAKDASADEIKKAYRKLARANHPDSNPDDAKKHELFKKVAEAYDVVGDADKRKKYDEFRSSCPAARSAASRTGFNRGGAAVAASTSTTFSATRAAVAAVRGHVRRPLRGRCAAPAPRTTTRQGRRRRGQHDARLRGRPQRDDDLAAADLRRAVRDVQGHRRQARHPAAHLSRVRGRRLRRRQQRRRFLDERDLPGLRWSPARLRRGVPHLPRLRPRSVDPHDPGPHPGRASRTARRSGCAARAPRARAAARPAT